MFNFKVDTINIDHCYLNSRCACGICIVLCVGTDIDDIVRCAFYADVRALYLVLTDVITVLTSPCLTNGNGIVQGVTVGGLFLIVLGGTYFYLDQTSQKIEVADMSSDGGAFDFKQHLKELINKGEIELHADMASGDGTTTATDALTIVDQNLLVSWKRGARMLESMTVEEVPRTAIQIGETIGGGNFGTVSIGLLKHETKRRRASNKGSGDTGKHRRIKGVLQSAHVQGRRPTLTFEVAVKQVKNDSNMSKGEYLIAEEALMKEGSLYCARSEFHVCLPDRIRIRAYLPLKFLCLFLFPCHFAGLA